MNIKFRLLHAAALCVCLGLTACGGKQEPLSPGSTPPESMIMETETATERLVEPEQLTPRSEVVLKPGSEISSLTDFVSRSVQAFDGVEYPEVTEDEKAAMMQTLPLSQMTAQYGVFYTTFELFDDVQELPVERWAERDMLIWKIEGEADSANPSLGKHYLRETVTLNRATYTLTIESMTEKDGGLVSRMVHEETVLPDNTVLSQYFECHADAEAPGGFAGNANIFAFNAESGVYEALIGTLKNPDPSFTYPSIVGKSDIDREGYKAIAVLDVTLQVRDGASVYIWP